MSDAAFSRLIFQCDEKQKFLKKLVHDLSWRTRNPDIRELDFYRLWEKPLDTAAIIAPSSKRDNSHPRSSEGSRNNKRTASLVVRSRSIYCSLFSDVFSLLFAKIPCLRDSLRHGGTEWFSMNFFISDSLRRLSGGGGIVPEQFFYCPFLIPCSDNSWFPT